MSAANPLSRPMGQPVEAATSPQPPASGVAANHKTCLNCGKIFERPRTGRNIQQPSIWNRRRYCSRVCGAIANAEKRRAATSIQPGE